MNGPWRPSATKDKVAVKKTILLVFCALTAGVVAHADLKVGLMPAYNSIPLVVAHAGGFFVARGVRVELVPFSSQLNRETALQTHAIDGTVSDLINAIQAWAHGFEVRVTSASEGDFALLSAPGSPLATMADVSRSNAPLRTGLLENSIVYYVTERMFESARIDPGRIDLVPIVALPARLQMLLAGKIEAACLPEPLATMASARGAHRLATTADMGTPGVILFTRKALAEKSEEISRFYRAYDEAVEEVTRNGESYRSAIIQGCEFPPAVKDLMQIPRFRASFAPPAAQVSDVARWMREKRLIEAEPRYDDIVASGFAAHGGAQPQ